MYAYVRNVPSDEADPSGLQIPLPGERCPPGLNNCLKNPPAPITDPFIDFTKIGRWHPPTPPTLVPSVPVPMPGGYSTDPSLFETPPFIEIDIPWIVAPKTGFNCDEFSSSCSGVIEREIANLGGLTFSGMSPAVGNRARVCKLNINCKEFCGPNNNLLGYTDAPVGPIARAQNGRQVFGIEICVSYLLNSDSVAIIFQHELIHARRFCNHGGIERNCHSCTTEETAAYRLSCRFLPRAKQDRCRRCGVEKSCEWIAGCPGGPRENPPCTLADLGVGLRGTLR
jgi:hypothetical protein